MRSCARKCAEEDDTCYLRDSTLSMTAIALGLFKNAITSSEPRRVVGRIRPWIKLSSARWTSVASEPDRLSMAHGLTCSCVKLLV